MMPPPETRNLARRLFAHEAIAGSTSERTEPAAFRVCEKLRPQLCALAGVAGYRSLLSRALTLARAEAPSLSAVQVTAEGSLQNASELEPQVDMDQTGEDGVLLVAQLLGLFVDFIGTALTLRLMQDVSPPLSVTATGPPIPMATILQEANALNDVSERLESLAAQHPFVEDALMTISGSIRNTAAVLEVLILVKSKSTEPVGEFGHPATSIRVVPGYGCFFRLERVMRSGIPVIKRW